MFIPVVVFFAVDVSVLGVAAHLRVKRPVAVDAEQAVHVPTLLHRRQVVAVRDGFAAPRTRPRGARGAIAVQRSRRGVRPQVSLQRNLHSSAVEISKDIITGIYSFFIIHCKICTMMHIA